RAMAEHACGGVVAVAPGQAAHAVRLGLESEGGEVDLGANVRLVCEAQTIRAVVSDTSVPAAATLAVPGTCRFGRWRLEARLVEAQEPADDPDTASLDADCLRAPVQVRSWAPGDRIQPLGMAGTKTLQDLFTDRHVPRTLRRSLPVVVDGSGRIAWVAGLTVAEPFRLTAQTARVAELRARLATGSGPPESA
ncbi:MAG: tRNA lysidine(34) synthetase TilS, partial [Solirubrobacterales bacterium]